MNTIKLFTLIFTFILIISCSEDKQKEAPQPNKNVSHKVIIESVNLLNKQFKKLQQEKMEAITKFNEYQYIIIPTIAKITNDGKGFDIIETLYSGKELTKKTVQYLFDIQQFSNGKDITKSTYFPNGVDYRYKLECSVDKISLMKKYSFYKKITLKILDGTVINQITFSIESCTRYLNYIKSKK